jgi:hypothetical protein
MSILITGRRGSSLKCSFVTLMAGLIGSPSAMSTGSLSFVPFHTSSGGVKKRLIAFRHEALVAGCAGECALTGKFVGCSEKDRGFLDELSQP